MTAKNFHKKWSFSAAATTNATGIVTGLEVMSVSGVKIWRFGIIPSASLDPDANGFAVAVQRRPIAGVAGSEVTIDTLTLTDTQVQPAARVVYRDVVVPVAAAAGDDTLDHGVTPQTSVINFEPAGPGVIPPGQSAVVNVTNASGVAVNAVFWIEFTEEGFATGDANVFQATA